MSGLFASVWAHIDSAWLRPALVAWDRFWFTPGRPHTLALVRILGGGMLLYTHLVWSIGLTDFLGATSWITAETAAKLGEGADGRNFTFSYLSYVQSPLLLWVLHIAALVVFAMLMLGLYTRVVAVLAFVITLSYCHRLTGSLFGLDQINALLAMYLMLAPCGAVYSLDRWLADRRGLPPLPSAHVMTTIATRLIQIQMCVIYLFGGIGKMRGELWWDGSAVWFAAANLEYQSISLTWLVHYPWLIALLTHITVFWETFYPVLIWPRLTRPVFLAMAVPVHLGIAIFLGMPTFGLVMLIGNLAFVAPEYVEQLVNLLLGRKQAVLPAAATTPISSRETIREPLRYTASM